MNQPSKLMPALIGGAAAGVASGLPVLGCGCCLFAMGGGILASFLYSKQCKDSGMLFNAGQGAVVGLMVAPFFAIAATVVGGVMQLVMGSSMEDSLAQMEQMGQDIPPEVMDFLVNAGPFIMFAIGFAFWLVLGLIFATIGGVIGGALFKNEPADTVPPTV